MTAAAPDIVPAWQEQLVSGGRLVLPLELWPGLQMCAAFEPAGDYLESVAAAWCGFLPMGGEFGAAEELEAESPGEGCVSESGIEKRLRGLRDVSLAAGVPFPEWFRMRVYPRGSGQVPDTEELIIEKRWSRFALDKL